MYAKLVFTIIATFLANSVMAQVPKPPDTQDAFCKENGYSSDYFDCQKKYREAWEVYFAADPETKEIAARIEKQQNLPGARIGMSKKTVLTKTSWGEPRSIHSTTTRHGTHEQWVYGDGNYLYFTNGRLTAIQN